MQRFSSGQVYTESEQRRWLADALRRRKLKYKPWPKAPRAGTTAPMDAPKQRKSTAAPLPPPPGSNILAESIGLSVDEVARLARVAARTVSLDVRRGLLPAERVVSSGRRWRYEVRREVAEAYAADRRAMVPHGNKRT